MIVQPRFDTLADTWINLCGKHGGPLPNYSHVEKPSPDQRQDEVMVHVDALGANAVFFVNRRHLADCALDIVRFVKRAEDRLRAEYDHVRAGVQAAAGSRFQGPLVLPTPVIPKGFQHS